ncbi:hypothetical protein GCM10009748_23080 [Agromyces lapidis]|uniref:Uncharacterized protein n=1 Tax=Agromyces lapidis TaxID=279574 RepID=A0ABV5SPC4_9MICO
MPKVEMVVLISGTRNGVDWPAVGGFIDVPAQEAAELIANGFARAPEGKSAESEKATARRKPEQRGGLTKASLG